jgi:hypothetical protein
MRSARSADFVEGVATEQNTHTVIIGELRFAERTARGRVTRVLEARRESPAERDVIHCCSQRGTETQPRWLPIAFELTRQVRQAHWLDFGAADLTEPFFNQTVRRLRSSQPPPMERVTDLSTVTDAASGCPSIQPAGVIFHVSRCGSTLIANALRLADDLVVLSEAPPVVTFLYPESLGRGTGVREDENVLRQQVLSSVLQLYSRSAAGNTRRVVIKCSPTNILNIALVRAIWPEVPFLIVIRDPIEVAMSNLALPSHWCRLRDRPHLLARLFGVTGDLTIEEWYARAIGHFTTVARDAMDHRCRVIDYKSLTAETITEVGKYFGVDLPSPTSDKFQALMKNYSKDATGLRGFTADAHLKQERAPAALRNAVREYARAPYDLIRKSEAW